MLFDRDGTLITDIPHNSDPGRVEPVPGARAALHRLRRAGLAVGVVTNQSGIARGLLSWPELNAVNKRVEALLGPFDVWQICPHLSGCSCRKPAPGLILGAAQALHVRPQECVVVGDIGADVEAAENAGARGILVPTATTLSGEIHGEVADNLIDAVSRILGDPEPDPSYLDRVSSEISLRRVWKAGFGE
ncbi:HAD-IIIA family hydrolase [Streptosporangiaceae bacterium NEAU-GS5]|nr:HAD-IIIA family hydrolase [Streptosporangiaceae bacterium NEAU-GS5]